MYIGGTIGRKTKAAQNKSKARLKETAEQNLVRLQKDKIQHEALRERSLKRDRQQKDRIQHKSRLYETVGQIANRQRNDRARKALSKSYPWRSLQNVAFNYDPQTHYDQHSVVRSQKGS